MPSYRTLDNEVAAKAINNKDGLEALIVDDKLMGVIAGNLRIYADKGMLKVSAEEKQDG